MRTRADFEHIDAATAIAAARAQAFTEHLDEDASGHEPRTIVHSVSLGTAGLMLGADWDLDGLIEALQHAQEIGWFDDFMGHDLAVKTAEGQFLKFDVKRPAVSR